jgi:outer membrane murein-binding lipoprotein Lpp
MKYFLHTLAIVGLGSALLVGCNETTRDDVTAARQRINTEERRLEDVKREEARKIDEEKREAEQARVTNKPIVGDDFNEGPAEEAREAERARKAAQDRIQRQREQVDDAARTADDKEARLVQEQARDKFLIDCKAAIDMADRAVEKLQTEKNAADEPGKQTLDQRINTIKAKRDALQTKINDIRSADVMRWSDHKAMAQKAMDELNREVSTVS